MKEKIIVIGGGAAGFFSAINIAEKNRNAELIIIEKSDALLHKVAISGGGRCNVTHQCFIPSHLVKNYPRGEKELLSVFTRFQPKDTIAWFAQRGVQIKAEADGRMFPVSDNSKTIIDCFMREAKRLNIRIVMQREIDSITQDADKNWTLVDSKGEQYKAIKVVVCSGSALRMWKTLGALKHQIENPVPSLFTFNIKDAALHALMGTSFEQVQARINGSKLTSAGPLLITHWGLSGPAILKLSAWGARELANRNYKFDMAVNWIGGMKFDDAKNSLLAIKKEHPKKQLSNTHVFQLSNRFWLYILAKAGIDIAAKWGDLSAAALNKMVECLVNSVFSVSGKSTFKDEFVTCGGLSLKEIDFKTMESKLYPNLYFAGEVIDVDAITGGFNFQAAWSTGWVVSEACKA